MHTQASWHGDCVARIRGGMQEHYNMGFVSQANEGMHQEGYTSA